MRVSSFHVGGEVGGLGICVTMKTAFESLAL